MLTPVDLLPCPFLRRVSRSLHFGRLCVWSWLYSWALKIAADVATKHCSVEVEGTLPTTSVNLPSLHLEECWTGVWCEMLFHRAPLENQNLGWIWKNPSLNPLICFNAHPQVKTWNLWLSTIRFQYGLSALGSEVSWSPLLAVFGREAAYTEHWLQTICRNMRLKDHIFSMFLGWKCSEGPLHRENWETCKLVNVLGWWPLHLKYQFSSWM